MGAVNKSPVPLLPSEDSDWDRIRFDRVEKCHHESIVSLDGNAELRSHGGQRAPFVVRELSTRDVVCRLEDVVKVHRSVAPVVSGVNDQKVAAVAAGDINQRADGVLEF